MKVFSISLKDRKLQLYVTCVLLIIVIIVAVLANQGSLAKETSDMLDYSDPILNTTNTTGKTTKPRLAIIIDDFGSSDAGVKDMLAIDRKITCAVMPFCDNTTKQSQLIETSGKEVIIHLSMESLKYKTRWLGPKPIMNDLTKTQIEEIVQAAMKELPMAVGANNHMGSLVSANESIMRTILSVLSKKNMYFVDSKTTPERCASSLSSELKIPVFERNVFLDGDRSYEQIVAQLKVAASLAVTNGAAIAIGHVGAAGGEKTAKAIKDTLSYIDSLGVELVFVSDLKK